MACRGCLLNAQEWFNIFTSVSNDEDRVRRIILITLMLVGCKIGGCLDQADALPVGETRVQDQSNKRSGGDTEGQRPVRTACKTEIEKLCTGEPRAGRCLQDQKSGETVGRVQSCFGEPRLTLAHLWKRWERVPRGSISA